MTTNFKPDFITKSDQELLEAWANASKGSSEQSLQLLEVMQFRAAIAQNRAAIAAEKYTRLTFWLLVVTSAGVLASLFSLLCK